MRTVVHMILRQINQTRPLFANAHSASAGFLSSKKWSVPAWGTASGS